MHIDMISMGLPILYFKESQVELYKFQCFLAMKVDLILANSADPDEMQLNAAFHLGLHCLPKYLLGFPVYKGLKIRALPLLTIIWFWQQ